MSSDTIKGRGAAGNPVNRFEEIHFERNTDEPEEERIPPATRFYRDQTKTILTRNDSPDVGFEVSINPYRGCEHGCIYCYARPTHEYLGFSAGLDFETRIMVKEEAPELLREELSSPKWKPKTIALSGVTDCYQPAERHFRLTRRCLEVLAEFRNPAGIVTKSHLVTRDLDLLRELARCKAAAVFISITTLDADLARRLEPRAALPEHRLAAVAALRQAGVPAGVLMAPVIPGLTDQEIPSVLEACARAGAQFAGYVPLRLPLGLPDLFEDWLVRHFPGRREKILNRIRSLRGGKLNDSNFGSRMRGEGPVADQIRALFSVSARKFGLTGRAESLSTASFRVPLKGQLTLFD